MQAQMDRQKAKAAQTAPVSPFLGQQPRRSAKAPALLIRLFFPPLSTPRRPALSFKRPPPLPRRSSSPSSLSRRPAPRQLVLLSASAPKVPVLKLNPPKPPAIPAQLTKKASGPSAPQQKSQRNLLRKSTFKPGLDQMLNPVNDIIKEDAESQENSIGTKQPEGKLKTRSLMLALGELAQGQRAGSEPPLKQRRTEFIDLTLDEATASLGQALSKGRGQPYSG